MHERLLAAVGNRTYRHIGELTGIHPETVRRYLSGQTPSVEFIASLSRALNISAEWLLTGSGPMKCEEVRAHALSQAEPGELLRAISGTMERLIDRVERMEIYMQSLETRIRAQQSVDGGNGSMTAVLPEQVSNGALTPANPGLIESKPAQRASRAASLPASDGRDRDRNGGGN